jgi:hypothetical protein
MTYNRFTDTSYLPREPIIAGHKVSSREHMHTMMTRNPEMMRDKIKQLIKLKKELGKGDETDLLNYIDSGRLNDINKQDMHKQRQLHRNRKAQIRNVIECVLREYMDRTDQDSHKHQFANATRLGRVIFQKPSDPNNPKHKRRKVEKSVDSWRVVDAPERANVDSN